MFPIHAHVTNCSRTLPELKHLGLNVLERRPRRVRGVADDPEEPETHLVADDPEESEQHNPFEGACTLGDNPFEGKGCTHTFK